MNQYQLNKAIEAFIRKKDKKKETYAKKDISYIQQYEGSGSKRASGEGMLCEFYTPEYICELMWKIAKRHGYKGGYVLEPAVGTGRILKYAPDYKQCVGFEVNPLTQRIASLTCPKAGIYRQPFETAFMQPSHYASRLPGNRTWLKEYPFSLVIGNPPFGIYKNKYSKHFQNPQLLRTEIVFIYYGLQLLKKKGLLVYLTLANFVRNGNAYNKAKEEIGKIADLVDAYRLPAVFKHTKVATDILVFRKK